MAVVDASYRFVYVDVGAEGRVGDAGVYNNCRLSQALEQNTLNIPGDSRIEGADLTSPYTLVGDEAFPLKSYLMKPYHRRGLVPKEIIFNYRLSRARRVAKNAFGILANRFLIFKKPIQLKVSSAKKVIMAAVCLHNFLRHKVTEDDNEIHCMGHDEPVQQATRRCHLPHSRPF